MLHDVTFDRTHKKKKGTKLHHSLSQEPLSVLLPSILYAEPCVWPSIHLKIYSKRHNFTVFIKYTVLYTVHISR